MISIMKDSFGRDIDYMRISITDRCNLRCNYCMPREGVELYPMSEVLTYEEIALVCEKAAELGIKKVRITGGEPLVRRQVHRLIAMLKGISGISEVGLTTNGVLLKEQLGKLLDSGLDAINISLDVSDHEAYEKVTGCDYYDNVMEGIQAAYNSGIKTKINTVLINGQYYKDMFRFARDYNIDVRFIELMPIGMAKGMNTVSYAEVLDYVDSTYIGWKWDATVHGNGPARYLTIPGFKGAIGLISPINDSFCDGCDKLRLTATGMIKPCLCYDKAFDVKAAIRGGSPSEVSELIKKSILAKPEAHCFDNTDKITETKRMVSIGG